MVTIEKGGIESKTTNKLQAVCRNLEPAVGRVSITPGADVRKNRVPRSHTDLP